MLAAALPDSLARVATIGIDARVLAVAAVAALVTGLVSGIGPALQGSSPALSTALSESTRGGGTSRGRRRARAALVVAEVALAVVLLVGASLFIGSFVNVMRVDSGFRSDRRADGACSSAHESRIGAARSPPGPMPTSSIARGSCQA